MHHTWNIRWCTLVVNNAPFVLRQHMPHEPANWKTPDVHHGAGGFQELSPARKDGRVKKNGSFMEPDWVTFFIFTLGWNPGRRRWLVLRRRVWMALVAGLIAGIGVVGCLRLEGEQWVVMRWLVYRIYVPGYSLYGRCMIWERVYRIIKGLNTVGYPA